MQSFIERRVFHNCGIAHISVENKTENWHARVNSRVAQDQETIVNRNSDKVEHNAEDCLNYCDYETSMDDKLAENSTSFITESTVP